jgi:hypothetical protein
MYLVSIYITTEPLNLLKLIHPDDIDKVREQLSTTESQNTGRILDLKSMPIIRYNELYIFKAF